MLSNIAQQRWVGPVGQTMCSVWITFDGHVEPRLTLQTLQKFELSDSFQIPFILETRAKNLTNCQEIRQPIQASPPNSLATNQILFFCFLFSEQAFNDIKSLPHYCCTGKTVLTFFFLLQQQHFISITHFCKDHEQESLNLI